MVQLDRGGAYVNAAQAITVQHHEAHIVAYLGFILLTAGRPLSQLTLSCYEEPKLFLSFITFLSVSGEGSYDVNLCFDIVSLSCCHFITCLLCAHCCRHPQAKEVSWTHVYHHLSLAGKVLAYLEARAAVAGNPHPSHLEHLKRMGPWLVSTKR